MSSDITLIFSIDRLIKIVDKYQYQMRGKSLSLNDVIRWLCFDVVRSSGLLAIRQRDRYQLKLMLRHTTIGLFEMLMSEELQDLRNQIYPWLMHYVGYELDNVDVTYRGLVITCTKVLEYEEVDNAST